MRKDDQAVDAFSAPKSLISEAKARAAGMRLTKSGFYRYCLAKMLGRSEDEALEIAEHGSVRNSIAAMNDSSGTLPPLAKPEPNPNYKPKPKRKKK